MVIEIAIFAGGCFWCLQPPFERLDGVLETKVGYTGGLTADPTYDEVSTGQTGHLEAIQVTFDAEKIPYERLLDVFWRNIDPTQVDGQFADRGTQYETAIFFLDEPQRVAAEASKARLVESRHFNKPIVTKILPAGKFYPAELEHQGYYKKNAKHYERYKVGSGRAGYLEKEWGGK